MNRFGVPTNTVLLKFLKDIMALQPLYRKTSLNISKPENLEVVLSNLTHLKGSTFQVHFIYSNIANCPESCGTILISIHA